MTLSELEKEVIKYIAKGYGDCELRVIDQSGGNVGKVVNVYKSSSGKIIIEVV